MEVEKNTRQKKDVCKEFGIASSSLSTILKDRESIIASVSSSDFLPDRKKRRKTTYDDIDNALYAWFAKARTTNTHISGPLLMKKGEEIARDLGHHDFQMNGGWLDRFKIRRGISMRSLQAEASLVPQKWFTELQSLLQAYPAQDIYAADETGLLYSCLPNTQSLKDKVCGGEEQSKDCITLLLAANMDGSDKLPLLCIGKQEKPRCFQNILTLPVEYKHNTDAWMTPVLFEAWVRTLDDHFQQEKRRIVLVVDASNAHIKLKIKNLKAITLAFLSSTPSSILQPFDQGITLAFKQLYRKFVLRKLLAHLEIGGSMEELNLDLLDALTMSRTAWNNVSESAINKSFHIAGFYLESDEISCEPQSLDPLVSNSQTDPSDTANTDELIDLFQQLDGKVPLDSTVDTYINIDNNIKTSEGSTNEITTSVKESSTITCSNQTYEEVKQESICPPPTVKEALNALQTLKRFLLSQDNCNLNFIDNLAEIEAYVQDAALKL